MSLTDSFKRRLLYDTIVKRCLRPSAPSSPVTDGIDAANRFDLAPLHGEAQLMRFAAELLCTDPGLAPVLQQLAAVGGLAATRTSPLALALADQLELPSFEIDPRLPASTPAGPYGPLPASDFNWLLADDVLTPATSQAASHAETRFGFGHPRVVACLIALPDGAGAASATPHVALFTMADFAADLPRPPGPDEPSPPPAY